MKASYYPNRISSRGRFGRGRSQTVLLRTFFRNDKGENGSPKGPISVGLNDTPCSQHCEKRAEMTDGNWGERIFLTLNNHCFMSQYFSTKQLVETRLEYLVNMDSAELCKSSVPCSNIRQIEKSNTGTLSVEVNHQTESLNSANGFVNLLVRRSISFSLAPFRWVW
jgi:hypothetical protein